jgi:uncharacterized protein (TIGR02453 family)
MSKLKAPKFNEATFKYFDLAKKNKAKKEWFEKNKLMYEENVKQPFSHLLQLINDELGQDLKKIKVDPQKITRPLRPSNRAVDLGWVKDQTHATLWETKTSLFEWNPAIHIQFGSGVDDNLIGVGLYMVSSRQMYKFRDAAFRDYETLDEIINDKKFKSRWGHEFGEKYKRFPKGYDQTHPSAQYLWCKQFFVSRNFTRKEVISPRFITKAVEDIKLSMPFFKWVRQAVGTYQRKYED